MSRNDRRRGGRNRNWNNRDNNEKSERNERNRDSRQNENSERRHESRGSSSYERRQERRRFLSLQNQQNQRQIEENQNAIRIFKEKSVKCEICGELISDIANAITNRGSTNPVHFDCVIKKLSETEKTGFNEKISYIGQGRFAILHFDNPHDQKHFSIKKIIEWESRDSERGEWRNEMAGLYSQVK